MSSTGQSWIELELLLEPEVLAKEFGVASTVRRRLASDRVRRVTAAVSEERRA